MEVKAWHPPLPDALKLTNVKFIVLTPERVQEMAKLAATNPDTTTSRNYVMLSWNDYLAMGQNMQRLLEYIKADQVLLCYYRRELKEARCKDVQLPEDPMLTTTAHAATK